MRITWEYNDIIGGQRVSTSKKKTDEFAHYILAVNYDEDLYWLVNLCDGVILTEDGTNGMEINAMVAFLNKNNMIPIELCK